MLVLIACLEFGIEGVSFKLNGQVFVVQAAEITPSRHPYQEWRGWIDRAKYVGFNCIAVNVIWREYELENGNLDFNSPQHNVRNFVSLCAQAEMYVIVRAGPFLHAGANLGGWPYLLINRSQYFRSSKDSGFQDNYLTYFKFLVATLAGQSIANNGPILIWQLDDHYQQWEAYDEYYLQDIQQIIIDSGFEGVFLTADDPSEMPHIFNLSNTAIGLDFKDYDQQAIMKFQMLYPNTVIMISRLIASEESFWGLYTEQPICSSLASTIVQLIQENRSFVLTPFAVSTNYGSLAGSQMVDGLFKVQTTRQGPYALFTETGDPAMCFKEVRDAFSAASSEPASDMPEPIPKQQIPPFKVEKQAGIFDQIYQTANVSQEPPNLQALPFEAGALIYSVILSPGKETNITFDALQDYAVVYVGGKYVGSYNRQPYDLAWQEGQPGTITFFIPALSEPALLEVFVQVLGYSEFQYRRPKEPKGMVSWPTFERELLSNWTLKYARLRVWVTNTQPFDAEPQRQGGIFQGVFVAQAGKSTFFEISNYRRGLIAVNGHILGNYQNTGPQHRMYCPGAWLTDGNNTLLIIDFEQQAAIPMTGFELAEGCPEGKKLYEGFCQ